jgi:redox-sensitive bicupin YhaK (pirin superfamily)
MDTSEFEAKLKREGFLDMERKQAQPNFTSKPHTHPYDVRVLVIDGEITLDREGKAQTFRAGDVFEMTAGCLHTEHYGPAGYTYLVGRRHPPG